MGNKIQFRRDTVSNWSGKTATVPAVGEPCYDTTNRILKIGDGANTFANLPALIPEAPQDGRTYGRNNGAWVALTTSGGQWIYIAGGDSFYTVATSGGSGSGSGSGGSGSGQTSITFNGNNQFLNSALAAGTAYRAVIAYGIVKYYDPITQKTLSASASSGLGSPNGGSATGGSDYALAEVNFTVSGNSVTFQTASILMNGSVVTLTLTGSYSSSARYLSVSSASANGYVSYSVTLCGVKQQV